ncbi:MAG: hypothetical protein V4759_05250 [Pseudomonadota bacterium]
MRDGLCVDAGGGPKGWVEVRLADFYAPELSSPEGPAAKRALEQVSLGRRLECVAEKQSYDRIVARCRIEDRPLGDLLRDAGGHEGGRGAGDPSASAEGVSAQAGSSWRNALAAAQQAPAGALALISVVLIAALAAIWRKPAERWRRRAHARRASRLFQQELRNAPPPPIRIRPRARRNRSAKPREH